MSVFPSDCRHPSLQDVCVRFADTVRLPHFTKFTARVVYFFLATDGAAFAHFCFAADFKMGHSKFYELDFELSIQTFACLLCSLTTCNLGHPIYQDEIVMTTRNQ